MGRCKKTCLTLEAGLDLDSVKGKKQARKLQATLEDRNPKLCPATRSLTGVECRATSVAKNIKKGISNGLSLRWIKKQI